MDANVVSKRKISLKDSDSEKKINKLKGIEDRTKQRMERISKTVNEAKHLKLDTYQSTKERFYEEFLTRKLDNFKNFTSITSETPSLEKTVFESHTNLPPLRECESREHTFSKFRPAPL